MTSATTSSPNTSPAITPGSDAARSRAGRRDPPPIPEARNAPPLFVRPLPCTQMNRLLRPLLLAAALLPALPAFAGTVTGTISNAATRNLLEGARVEVPRLGLSALTDATGRYVLVDIPDGTHELVASYLGLDPARGTVTVAGAAANRPHAHAP